ncbi:MAG: cell wall-binding repeat-containing protein [Actinobacteria bacterium]|nr:MAG: cell wall-binding repeat-containing protein [Actinomycetota bacterium]
MEGGPRTVKPRRHRVAVCALALIALAALLGAPGNASAITRDAVLDRGKVWVDRFVPYSNSGWANEAGDIVANSSLGWRRDCSGFASYCLNLRYANGTPLSYHSGTIDAVLTPITKEQLRPGDIINRPNDAGYAYGHSIVFVNWANEEHTEYWSYEQSSSRGGTCTRLVVYPFWGEPGFAPYRYNRIEEDYEPWCEPIEGANRYETAVAASRASFPETGSADTAIVCSGLTWPDALGGAGLAGAVDGPVLLTDPRELPGCVAEELARLGVTRAVIVGGERAVSSRVASALAEAGVAQVDRIGGADRYETAARVAEAAAFELMARGESSDGTAYLASGENFPDALAASPAARFFGRPVLLTRASALPSATADALESLSTTRVLVLGAAGAVSSHVASAAGEGRVMGRLAGLDRYATSIIVARHATAEGMSWAGLGVAAGGSYCDALAGGSAQGKIGSPLLLTPGTALAGVTAREITAHAEEIGRAHCYGGPKTLTTGVRLGIATCLGM